MNVKKTTTIAIITTAKKKKQTAHRHFFCRHQIEIQSGRKWGVRASGSKRERETRIKYKYAYYAHIHDHPKPMNSMHANHWLTHRWNTGLLGGKSESENKFKQHSDDSNSALQSAMVACRYFFVYSIFALLRSLHWSAWACICLCILRMEEGEAINKSQYIAVDI